MNFKYQNTKNLMSKDAKIADQECKRILDKCDVKTFSDLCENSEFIFDFIKDKINKNFLNNVNKNNYLNLLEFAKIYCADFEDFIVLGLVKFANEELTDKILELFENGSDSEKTYFARYFYYIQDNLALNYLKESALSNFAPLSYNSARTLNKFGDRTLYNKEIEIIEGDFDDFEKIKAVCFLVFYGDVSAFDTIYKYMEKTPFLSEVVESLLDLKPISDIEQDKALVIYDNLIDLYPEFVSLETLIPYNIKEYIKSLLNKKKTPFVSFVLYKTRIKFNVIGEGDIYTYDLSKETNEEIKEIIKIINSVYENFEDKFEKLLEENDSKLVENVLDTIIENNLATYKDKISDLLNTSDNEIIIFKCLSALKTFGETLPQNMADRIKNENIKALVQSLY